MPNPANGGILIATLIAHERPMTMWPRFCVNTYGYLSELIIA